MNYSNIMNHMAEQELARVELLKQMVMKYPYYTDKMREAWMDALDGMMDVKSEAIENARQSLDDAFNNRRI